ncbi:hypothetical protein A8L34_09260 [Bacillus sp. FJAT-27264]|uniref:DUF4179 domain-containing protein n=1 Tax=Paenibacillus sp. (strain DSM 101736 / FJAT-27264) TaxID=1850362 RepID=UPI000807E07E|nr:DUF4179 domain-containing protein [Bacillus sp. FJAT-27264]OBZ14143.1 hypothetical protein A8L34_09260 [Bacillus sp. FJAT-27264]
MIDKEKDILLRNAHEVNQHAEAFEEKHLYNAMRGGIMTGRKRERRRKYSLGIGMAAAAVAIILILSIVKAPVKEVAQATIRSEVNKEWSDSELFRSVRVDDQSYISILDRNLIDPVYHSAEKNGLKVEVMGGATDGRKVFILYSVENKTDKLGIHTVATLHYGNFEAPSIGTSLTSSKNEVWAGQTAYYVYSAKLPYSVTYPKDVKFDVTLNDINTNSKKYRTELDIPFELDPDMFKDQQHTVSTNRTLIVDGQKINVKQVLYTPLGTYVDIEYDKDNDKQIFQLLNPVLMVKKAGQTEKTYYPSFITSSNSEVYTDSSKATLVFKSSEYNDPDSISLKAFGISAVEKDQMKIVIDLNKNEIIEAPGSNLELVEPKPEDYAEPGEILLRHKFGNAQYLSSTYNSLADTFTDAEGQVHKQVSVNKTTPGGNFGGSIGFRDGTAEDQLRYRFGEKAKDYPQPLTITIERYKNPIMDTQVVELYSKK